MKRFLFAALFAALCLPLAARTIYVTRHGQVGDKKYRIQIDKSLKENTLTPLGIEQAELLAEYLVKKNNFAGDIYVSPLYRTVETGSYTAKLLNKKVILFPGIQEIAPKKTPRGMNKAEIENNFPGKTIAGKDFTDNWRLSFESREARQARVNAALDKLLAETTNDLLLVSHGGTVGNIVKYFNAKCDKNVNNVQGTVWNCSLFKFEINSGGKVTNALYTTEYLPDEKVTSNFRTPKIPRPDDPQYENSSSAAKKKAVNERRKGERLLLITRHCQTSGQTRPDVIRPVPGDTAITRLGIKQSHALGKAIKALGFDGAFYSSPYYRATATACEAAKECGAKVYPYAGIQQRAKRPGGNIKGGATLAVFRKLYPAEIAADAALADDWLKTTVEKGYDGEHQKRLEKALDEILAKSNKDVAIFSHGGGVGTFLQIMQKKCGIEKIKGVVWNCALFKFAVDAEGKCRFIGYDISFMPESEVTSNEGRTLAGIKSGKEKKFNSRIDHDDK